MGVAVGARFTTDWMRPSKCRCRNRPQCGGRLKETELVSQYQTEIPEPRVERIEFRIHRPLPAMLKAGPRAASAIDFPSCGRHGIASGATGAGVGHILE